MSLAERAASRALVSALNLSDKVGINGEVVGCENGSGWTLALTGGCAGGTYIWSTGTADESSTGVMPNVYSLAGQLKGINELCSCVQTVHLVTTEPLATRNLVAPVAGHGPMHTATSARGILSTWVLSSLDKVMRLSVWSLTIQTVPKGMVADTGSRP
jgi:hypothetical protein